jgi:hypothetical protein
MKEYLDFWKEATLILTLNVEPYCLCVDLAKVNLNIHFKEKFENNKGGFDEYWNFLNIYTPIYENFPKVTKENFEKALPFLCIK